jgi:Uma2 family endonuclease
MNLALNHLELPIRISQGRPVTDEELMRLSAENELLRLERDANGELIVMSPTGTGGSGFESDVFFELSAWARADGRGKAFVPTAGFKLPDTSVRAADAAWVSHRRLDSVSPEQRKGYWPVCPEFVIEVRSESDKLRDIRAKMNEWIANGVEVAWLIDPIEKAVTIYRPGDEPEHHDHPTSVQGTGPIAGFELVMARIWE